MEVINNLFINNKKDIRTLRTRNSFPDQKVVLICLTICLITGLIISKSTFGNKPFIQRIPWENGPLQISKDGRYLKHSNGTPFFWLGDTGWLLPQRLDKKEAVIYLDNCRDNGYTIVQVQVLNECPSVNIYGNYSMKNNFDFSKVDSDGENGYWQHLDFIVRKAKERGIYIAMVCIWGELVKEGKLDAEQAKVYGSFLAHRYSSEPNIIWIIGGDITGDTKPEVWNELANSIKSVDTIHLMTFHPRGRTSSATWFHAKEWLDFDMFQSGHRRYGQRMGDVNYPIPDSTEEDNWRFVSAALQMKPSKPVVDGEPSYEDIPQGLHDQKEPRWQACDIRRYAYWSVFAGSCGHTYGNNNIMQMYKPGFEPAYGANRYWYEALNDEGRREMKYLKKLMLSLPYFDRIPDQSIISGENGVKYDRLIATRGKDYLLVYNYSGRKMEIDLSKISGIEKQAWWFNPRNGKLTYIGEFKSMVVSFQPPEEKPGKKDFVLLVRAKF
jgi:hypothetical protein